MTGAEWASLLLEYARNSQRAQSDTEREQALINAWPLITRWATGRVSAEVAQQLTAGPGNEIVRDAALLFLRRVCFSPAATFYEMFGLRPDTFSPELLRKRYRALIRLAHPDVGVEGLPEGAAGAVNHAYSVLNNDGLRRRYDERLRSRYRRTQRAAAADASRSSIDRPGASGGARSRWRLRAAVAAWRERALTRWVRVSTRWRRQFPVALVMLVAVAVMWLLTWNVGHRTDANVIVAVVPDTDQNAAPRADAAPAQADAVSATIQGPLTVALGPAAHVAERADTEARDETTARQSESGAVERDSPNTAPLARSIDRQAVRRYVEALTLMTNNETAAIQIDRDLEQAGVHGTLLRPVLDLYRLYDQLAAEQLGWSVTERDGQLTGKAVVVVQVGSEGVWYDAYLYRLQAEFQDSEDGPVLRLLDFFSIN